MHFVILEVQHRITRYLWVYSCPALPETVTLWTVRLNTSPQCKKLPRSTVVCFYWIVLIISACNLRIFPSRTEQCSYLQLYDINLCFWASSTFIDREIGLFGISQLLHSQKHQLVLGLECASWNLAMKMNKPRFIIYYLKRNWLGTECHWELRVNLLIDELIWSRRPRYSVLLDMHMSFPISQSGIRPCSPVAFNKPQQIWQQGINSLSHLTLFTNAEDFHAIYPSRRVT